MVDIIHDTLIFARASLFIIDSRKWRTFRVEEDDE